MWIFTSDAFVSVVSAPGIGTTNLLVRARVRGDISRFMGAGCCVNEVETPRSDYRFRAVLPRHEVARAARDALLDVDYPNFKDSIPKSQGHRKAACLRVWGAMYDFQDAMHPGNRPLYGDLDGWKPAKRKRARSRRRASAKGGLR